MSTITTISLAVISLLSISAFVVSAISLKSSKKTARKLSDLAVDSEGKSLESVLLSAAERIKEMDGEIQDLFDISKEINSLAKRGLQRTGLIRYNPFGDVGGNQSFSFAILDEHSTGFLITSLHTRENNRIYLKTVIKGKTTGAQLTEEEQKAIKIAAPQKQGAV